MSINLQSPEPRSASYVRIPLPSPRDAEPRPVSAWLVATPSRFLRRNCFSHPLARRNCDTPTCCGRQVPSFCQLPSSHNDRLLATPSPKKENPMEFANSVSHLASKQTWGEKNCREGLGIFIHVPKANRIVACQTNRTFDSNKRKRKENKKKRKLQQKLLRQNAKERKVWETRGHAESCANTQDCQS